jgi:hypothetical protein
MVNLTPVTCHVTCTCVENSIALVKDIVRKKKMTLSLKFLITSFVNVIYTKILNSQLNYLTFNRFGWNGYIGNENKLK